jgi:predicted small metal-binding protein
MDKIVKCKDLGLDCVVEVCGHTEDEVLKKAGDHARTVHGADEASFLEKARAAMYEGHCDYADSEETISDECSACYDECSTCVDECCC